MPEGKMPFGQEVPPLFPKILSPHYLFVCLFGFIYLFDRKLESEGQSQFLQFWQLHTDFCRNSLLRTEILIEHTNLKYLQ